MSRIFTMIAILITTSFTFAQTVQPTNAPTSGSSKFLLTGFGYTGFHFTPGGIASFGETSLSPIFLWKHSKKFLIEAELEFVLSNDHTDLDFGYFNFQYALTKWATVRAGKFLSPFGMFSEKMHPAWINRLPTFPVGFGHDGVGPSSEIGIDVRGVFRLGISKLNYSVYVSNGPYLENGTNDTFEAGALIYNNNYSDNNKYKNYGGRIGILPFGNSSLEVGLSGQYGYVGAADHQLNGVYDKITETSTLMYAADLSYVKPVPLIKSILDIKAQYNNVTVDKAEFPSFTDSLGITHTYTYLNESTAYFAQLSVRPALLAVPVLKNTEFVGRYASLLQPVQSKWGSDVTQITLGINYWLSWKSVIKFAYETQRGSGSGGSGHSHGGSAPPAGTINIQYFYIQFATAF